MQLSASMDNEEISVGSWSPPSMESEEGAFLRNGLIQVGEGSIEYEVIKKSFLKGMDCMGYVTTIMAVHKNKSSCNLERQARSYSFRIFSKALATKSGGNANMRYAWYGGSLEELLEIVSFGFSTCSIRTEEKEKDEDESHGVGICLSPSKFSIDGAVSTVADDDGLRHMLLCRVILGRIEVVPPGSKQSQPSSKEYDSGVDNILAPRKYIIWSSFMNSHIHPDYIISFNYNYKDSRLPRALKPGPRAFSSLMPRLFEYLEPSKMALLVKIDSLYRERKIQQKQWIKKVREIVGDKLLCSLIKKLKGNVKLP